MADYNYVKETFEIETITDAIESLQKRILAFSDKIDTEDVTKLCNIIDDAKETAGCIYDHLSSLNTEKNRETYLNGINKKYAAKKVADLFKHTNVIDMTTLKVKGITSEDLVAFQEYYNVRLHESGWGTWRWLGIHDLQGNNLSFDEIHEKLGINTNEEKTISAPSEEEEKMQKYDNFGYVAPDGTFFPSDFGTHEAKAWAIIKAGGFKNSFNDWKRTSVDASGLARDFLINEKGYCLIHNPLMDGGYIVSQSPSKNLTKEQRETLYDYFTENGDSYLANAMFSQEDDYER